MPVWSTLGATLPWASLVSRFLSRRPRLGRGRSSRESARFRGSVLFFLHPSRSPRALRSLGMFQFHLVTSLSPGGVALWEWVRLGLPAAGLWKPYRDIPGEREKPGLLTPASYLKSRPSSIQSPRLASLLTFAWPMPLGWLSQVQKGNSSLLLGAPRICSFGPNLP